MISKVLSAKVSTYLPGSLPSCGHRQHTWTYRLMINNLCQESSWHSNLGRFYWCSVPCDPVCMGNITNVVQITLITQKRLELQSGKRLSSSLSVVCDLGGSNRESPHLSASFPPTGKYTGNIPNRFLFSPYQDTCWHSNLGWFFHLLSV